MAKREMLDVSVKQNIMRTMVEAGQDTDKEVTILGHKVKSATVKLSDWVNLVRERNLVPAWNELTAEEFAAKVKGVRAAWQKAVSDKIEKTEKEATAETNPERKGKLSATVETSKRILAHFERFNIVNENGTVGKRGKPAKTLDQLLGTLADIV